VFWFLCSFVEFGPAVPGPTARMSRYLGICWDSVSSSLDGNLLMLKFREYSPQNLEIFCWQNRRTDTKSITCRRNFAKLISESVKTASVARWWQMDETTSEVSSRTRRQIRYHSNEEAGRLLQLGGGGHRNADWNPHQFDTDTWTTEWLAHGTKVISFSLCFAVQLYG